MEENISDEFDNIGQQEGIKRQFAMAPAQDSGRRHMLVNGRTP